MICSECRTEKSAEDFYPYCRSRCKTCKNKHTQRRYRETHPIKEEPVLIGKVCSACRVDKPLSCYTKQSKSKHGVSSWCVSCKSSIRKTQHRDPVRNERFNTSRRVQANVNRAKSYEYRRNVGCIDCGERDPVVLDFDHRGDKKFHISNRVSSMRWEKLLLEVVKCDVRCSNCHRKKTATEQGWYKNIILSSNIQQNDIIGGEPYDYTSVKQE